MSQPKGTRRKPVEDLRVNVIPVRVNDAELAHLVAVSGGVSLAIVVRELAITQAQLAKARKGARA